VSEFSKWMTSRSHYWSVGPTASETIFDGGLRKSTMAQCTAIYDTDVTGYKQTVLVAFQQTEDYLVSLWLLARQIEQQQGTVASAQRLLDVATGRYTDRARPVLKRLRRPIDVSRESASGDYTPRTTDDEQCEVDRGFGRWLERQPAPVGGGGNGEAAMMCCSSCLQIFTCR